MIQICYFSPTGNAKYLAEKLSEGLGTEDSTLSALEFLEPKDLTAVEHLVILYSIHAFNAPRTVKRFVRNLPNDLSKRVSLIAVGCTDIWINSASSFAIRKELEKKGYEIAVDEVIAMPLTLVAPFPDKLITKTIREAEESISQIASLIISEAISTRTIPLKSKLLATVGRSEDLAARLFGLELFASKSCTSCGICVKRCPERNIKFNKKEIPRFGFNCLMCMRCIYECPEKAIKPRFSRFIPLKDGYSINNYIED
jgi:ferredoxin